MAIDLRWVRSLVWEKPKVCIVLEVECHSLYDISMVKLEISQDGLQLKSHTSQMSHVSESTPNFKESTVSDFFPLLKMTNFWFMAITFNNCDTSPKFYPYMSESICT